MNDGGIPDTAGKRYGFARRQRLLLSSEFEEAFAGGEGIPVRTLVLWVRALPGAARRLGVVASKRTFRHAVDRNRAKRLLREAFRLRRGDVPGDADVVLLARRRILSASRSEVEKDFLAACRKAGLRSGE